MAIARMMFTLPEADVVITNPTHLAVALQYKQGKMAAFVDAEHALNLDMLKRLGVDTEKIVLSQPDSGENALEMVELMVKSHEFAVVVVDSVAALTPQAEIDKDMGESVMGVHARLMSQAMRKLTAPIGKSPTAVIFINQTRSKIGFMGGTTTCVHPETLVELVIDNNKK